MGKTGGFLEADRIIPQDRPVEERLKDWKDVHVPFPEVLLKSQAGRCMDCGVPFCHPTCPLTNDVPDWNDLVYRGRWKEAAELLCLTNNFPEITGRVCPALCEEACVLNVHENPVTIRCIEKEIIERAFSSGWIKPKPPARRTGKKVAVVGSGPAGLACADQLNKAGHSVTVFERADRIGGLLRYGIPDFKLEKWILDRRTDLMRAEGIQFKTGACVGLNVSSQDLTRDFDAVVLAGGSTKPRNLAVPGRELKGIHFAMDYLTCQNRRNAGENIPAPVFLSAQGKNVVILGGGDTGADCLGTALRQGAKHVTSLELLPKPPLKRDFENPWPEYRRILRTSSSHEEGGVRDWSVMTKRFSGSGGVIQKVHLVRLEWKSEGGGKPPRMAEIPNSEFFLDADLVLLAMGFLGPETDTLIKELGVSCTERGCVAADTKFMTNREGVFVCGDMRRGQSLVVWAIQEGREAARFAGAFLSL